MGRPPEGKPTSIDRYFRQLTREIVPCSGLDMSDGATGRAYITEGVRWGEVVVPRQGLATGCATKATTSARWLQSKNRVQVLIAYRQGRPARGFRRTAIGTAEVSLRVGESWRVSDGVSDLRLRKRTVRRMFFSPSFDPSTPDTCGLHIRRGREVPLESCSDPRAHARRLCRGGRRVGLGSSLREGDLRTPARSVSHRTWSSSASPDSESTRDLSRGSLPTRRPSPRPFRSSRR